MIRKIEIELHPSEVTAIITSILLAISEAESDIERMRLRTLLKKIEKQWDAAK